MKTAYEYDLFLPLYYNNGKRVAAKTIHAIRRELVKEFGGLTFFRHSNLGLWKVAGFVYVDEIIVLRVITSRASEGRGYFKKAGRHIAKRLAQKSLMIIERRITLI